MVRYIIRRLLWVVVLLFLVSFITFIIFYIAARRPTPRSCAPAGSRTPSWWSRSATTWGSTTRGTSSTATTWNGLVLHFDFGYSYQNNIVGQGADLRPAAGLDLGRGRRGGALVLIAGITVGIISAVRQPVAARPHDDGRCRWSRSPRRSTGSASSPSTCSRPTSGSSRCRSSTGAGSYVPFSQDPSLWFQSLLLPWFVLAAAFAALYARLLRANLIEVMSEDYIRTARAKGLSERRVVLRHGLRSAITPIVTAAGPRHRHPARRHDPGRDASSTSPAIGRLAYDSIQNSDLPMIQGTVLLGAFFIIIANLVVDILYAFLDPRVRYS